MKKVPTLLFFCFLCATAVVAQYNSETISFKADSLLAKDNYGYFYFLKNNSLLKTNFVTPQEYQNTVLGKPTALDVQNPLQLVVFYKKFNTVVLLDNQLNETVTINGNLYNLVFETVGLARQNNIWFYDSVSQKFGLFNFKENTVNFISTSYVTSFKTSFCNYNNFYWITTDYVMFTLSFYGKISMVKQIPSFEAACFVSEKKYVLKSNENITYYNEGTVINLNLLVNSSSNFCFNNSILSIFTDNSVTNYKINLP
ncbi:hypothetical protein [Flavobacterium sp.]|uniref:hypothetical protein n=1 Tax=Flavobacterium sp. TaxID=239 RepID=UPI003526ED7F